MKCKSNINPALLKILFIVFQILTPSTETYTASEFGKWIQILKIYLIIRIRAFCVHLCTLHINKTGIQRMFVNNNYSGILLEFYFFGEIINFLIPYNYDN